MDVPPFIIINIQGRNIEVDCQEGGHSPIFPDEGGAEEFG